MQSVFSSPSHATLRGHNIHGSYRPDWSREDPATTVPKRRCGTFVGLALPQQQSPGVLSPSKKLASPTLGPHTVPSHSWAKVNARSTLPAGSSLPPPDHLLADPTNVWSPVGPRNRRERKQTVVPPSPLTANRGPKPPAGLRWDNGLSSPPERKSGAEAEETSFAQERRAVH